MTPRKTVAVKSSSALLVLLLSCSFVLSQNKILTRVGISESHKSKAVAFIFLGIDCPISQKYLLRLKNIRKKYTALQLTMVGIIPEEKNNKELISFSEKYNITFPILTDKRLYITSWLNAEVTPEVFLFDSVGNKKYQGAIDNWYYELGHYRQGENENYLMDAIEAIINGADPKIKKTKAIGCLIQSSAKK
jgi:peroxiredoxin